MNLDFLNKHRVRNGLHASTDDFGFNGAFVFALESEARKIMCIASDGSTTPKYPKWKHVSVTFLQSKSAPSWKIMCKIKDLFWDYDETVIQIHPARKDYINVHPGCLHLWQCCDGREQPLPPKSYV